MPSTHTTTHASSTSGNLPRNARSLLIACIALVASLLTVAHASQPQTRQPQNRRPASTAQSLSSLPDYTKRTEARGQIRSVGSSTVSSLINSWGNTFTTQHPALTFNVVGGGSASALPALLNGSCDIAPMSRAMNTDELKQFRDRFGYEPTRFVVGVDALAVYVHKDNPIHSLSLTQLDSIFSATHKRGGPPASRWGQLGLTGEWTDRPITIYGFGNLTGGYALFQELVLDGGNYVPTMKVEPGSSAIVNAVGAYREAIGFASQYFATARTRMVPIIGDDGIARGPDVSSCLDGSYPLARRLYLYVNKRPDQPVNPNVSEFITFILSRQGQEIVSDAGMFAVPADLAAEQIAKLNP